MTMYYYCYITIVLILLIVYLSYKVGKQSSIIDKVKVKKQSYEKKINDINVVIDKLQNNNFWLSWNS